MPQYVDFPYHPQFWGESELFLCLLVLGLHSVEKSFKCIFTVCLSQSSVQSWTIPWLSGFRESIRGQCSEFGMLLRSGSNPAVTDLFRTTACAADFRSCVAVHLLIIMLHLHLGYVIVYHHVSVCIQGLKQIPFICRVPYMKFGLVLFPVYDWHWIKLLPAGVLGSTRIQQASERLWISNGV